MGTGFRQISVLLVLLGVSINSISKSLPEAEFFSVRNGLSQSQVNCVMQDSYGFLWVGTQDGLNRYDGIRFTHYHYLPFDTLSISNNYIRWISEDTAGNLWIATDNGLNRFNREF